MIPLYKIVWKDPESLKQKIVKPVVAWSSQNWIAFTNGYNWKHPTENRIDTVFILNPDQPWETYRVHTQHNSIIIHLEWSENGNSFLTLDAKAVCKLWIPTDNFINQWECCNTIEFGDKDKVKKLLWLNTRNKFSIDVEKTYHKDHLAKFSTVKCDRSLQPLVNCNCFITVLSSGHVKVILLHGDNSKDEYSVRLGNIKRNVISADVCINESGKIFVAIQTQVCMVELFTVICKKTASGLELSVEIWPCIVPHMGSTDNNFANFKIVDLKCISIGPNDQVLIMSKNELESYLQLFEIRKEQVMLHSCFPRQPTSQQSVDTATCLKTIKFQTELQCMFLTNLHFTNLGKSKDLSLSPKLVIFDVTGSLQVYALHSWSPVLHNVVIECLQNDHISAAAFSPCDHCLFAVTDSGNCLMLLLPHYSRCQDKIRARNVVNLLHYCVLGSYVPWDLMMYLSLADRLFIEQCYQMFVEEFNEYNQYFQHLFSCSYSIYKAMFFQILKDYCGVRESYNVLLLFGLHHYITSQLQSEKELAMFDMVHKVCSTSKEIDIMKIISFIDTKDLNIFLASNPMHRPLIQWLTDYAIHFARLILSKNHHGQNWKLMMKYFDSSYLLCLRQLLLILYVTYQKNQSIAHVHPIFITMGNSMDITAQLFKLVSKLLQLSNGENIEIGMSDLPFSNLPLMYLEYPSDDPKSAILSTTGMIENRNDFDIYEFQLTGDPWDYIHQTALENPLSYGITTVNTRLRQIYDGINFSPSSLIHGEIVKQCCRCGCLTILHGDSSRKSNNIWKSCWKKHCYCGGFWKKVEWHA